MLSAYPGFSSSANTAESTGIADASVDGVIAGQAFHWFDAPKVVDEWHRILRPTGGVAIIWNDRQLDGDEFLAAYESFLHEWGTDYDAVSEQYENPEDLRTVLGEDYSCQAFDNEQILSLDGLKGRINSCSYMPAVGDENYEPMQHAIEGLFEKYKIDDAVVLRYKTNVYWSKPA